MDQPEEAIANAVNLARTERGFTALSMDPVLVDAARLHSKFMAEQGFFSHHGQSGDVESPLGRVKAAGGQHRSVGENIAMHDKALADADNFVDGWLHSPQHCENMLAPDWELTGVGLCSDADGRVFATQLFAIAPPVLLESVDLSARDLKWFSLRLSITMGRQNEAGAFVRNEFVCSGETDGKGVALLDIEIPTEPGSYHVSVGRRSKGDTRGWIGVYEGTLDVESDGAPTWSPLPSSYEDVHVRDEKLFEVSGSMFQVRLVGQARRAAILLLDNITQHTVGAGQTFDVLLEVKGNTGIHSIHVGVPEDGEQYLICREYEVDTERGVLTERESVASV